MPYETDLLDKPTIPVLGAGVAGLGTALELAERGYKVELLEQYTLGSGSSSRNPARMGHGFHYVDINTAILYLRSSIQVQRKYPGYLVGQDLPPDASVRHGRYFITKNSDYSKDTILKTYEAIRDEYARLIAEDKENEVFGPPEKFFRILDEEEYCDDVNLDLVSVGVETCEHLFNWHNFATNIKKIIEEHPSITLHEHTKVENIERGNIGEPRFKIQTQSSSNEKKVFECDYFVNSTWQNIEYLNDKIGLTMVPESRTNRLKTLLKVKLPESLINSNSMFFCMGQHCMMSNLGNGHAMMTYARVTNMDTSCDLTLNKNTERLLNGGATKEEKDAIAQQILKGVAHYIPEMAKAETEDVLFGIVQTQGKLTLEQLIDKNSSFHKRDYSGVREEQIGVISNPCIKLFYFVNNAEITADLIEKHIQATEIIHKCMEKIKSLAVEKNLLFDLNIERSIQEYLERYESSDISSSDINKIVDSVIKVLEVKNISHFKEHLVAPKNDENESPNTPPLIRKGS